MKIKIFDDDDNLVDEFIGERITDFVDDAKDDVADSFDDSWIAGLASLLILLIIKFPWLLILVALWFILKGVWFVVKTSIKILWWLTLFILATLWWLIKCAFCLIFKMGIPDYWYPILTLK